jgi:hypothetical protein
VGRDGFQKLAHRFLFAIGQDRQARHVPGGLLAGDNGDEVVPPLGQGNLIDAEGSLTR